MDENIGRGVPDGALFNESGGGPWGGGGSGGSGGRGGGNGGNGGGDGLGPRNPWSQPPRKRPTGGATPTALDEFLRRSREKFGGNLPTPRGGKPIWLWLAAAAIVLIILSTAVHTIGPQQRGVLTRFGGYAGTMGPGVQFSFPAPIDHVTKIDVDDIRTIEIGSAAENSQNLVLTGDQNIVDLAYSVRWNIRDPELFLFELSEPEDTIREIAESAMREELARVSLDDAIGPQRSQIEGRVAQRMQELLDSYRAGTQVQGVAIRQADPPADVNEAFKAVSAAQQEAQSYLNQARAYALQLASQSQGEVAAFDKVYEQYRLSPEVTRQRMYYETMEKVLAKTDKTVVEAGGVNAYLPLQQTPRSTPPVAQQEPAK